MSVEFDELKYLYDFNKSPRSHHFHSLRQHIYNEALTHGQTEGLDKSEIQSVLATVVLQLEEEQLEKNRKHVAKPA